MKMEDARNKSICSAVVKIGNKPAGESSKNETPLFLNVLQFTVR